MITDFWVGKMPCWELLDCSKYVYPEYIANNDRSRPCWEHPHTQCEKILQISIPCEYCRVFKLYGPNQLRPQ